MIAFDSHLDLAWNGLLGHRDLRLSAYTTRGQENQAPYRDGQGRGTVALPEMRRGRLAVCLATLLARSTGRPVPHLDFPSPVQARASALGQLAYYRGLEQVGEVRVIADAGALEAHVEAWQAWDAGEAQAEKAPPLGFVISMESADPILAPERLQDWWEAGVRVIGPAHYGPGRYADGTGTEGGVTEAGVRLLAEMDRLRVLLDLSHLADRAFWEALEAYGGPLLASHNNCRALVPHQRQFSDEQLRAIFERDGVIGVAFDGWMLMLGWVKGKSTNASISLDDVVDHIDHICQLAGNCRHAGIGSDLDGLWGCEQGPRDLDTIADLQQLPGKLAEQGYDEEAIAAVMHGNFLRLLSQSLPSH